MVKYFSSKDLVEIGVLFIALFILFLYSLKDFIKFMKKRRQFYEDYISCFHPKEDKLGFDIMNLFFRVLMVIMVIMIGKDHIVSLENESFSVIILYATLSILLIGSISLDLISTYIHMRTDYGISAEYISVHSLLIPNDKVVYEEYENEIIIYRKSRKKEKGAKLGYQAYDINKDQKFLNYVHTFYQKVESIV